MRATGVRLNASPRAAHSSHARKAAVSGSTAAFVFAMECGDLSPLFFVDPCDKSLCPKKKR
jgi:hypothetical protein